MVGGRGIDIDDRATHGELPARFDLVLAAVAHRDEPFDEAVAVEPRACPGDDRFDVLDVWSEPLNERADRGDDDRGKVLAAGAEPPHHPESPAHRLGRR